MAWQLTPYAIFHACIALVFVGIAVLAAKHRASPGATPLVVLSLSAALWAATAGGVLASSDPGLVRALGNLSYLAIVLVPISLLYFAEEYSGHETPLTAYGPAPLLVIPAITQVVVWTNSSHELMWTVREVHTGGAYTTFTTVNGQWFWVHSAYLYVLLGVGSWLLVKMLLFSDELYRSQAAAILLGVFTPWAANALYILDLVVPPFDPTPVAFLVTALAFLFAMYRQRLLELVPVARELARDELINSLTEAVYILDDNRRIVDLNVSAASLAGSERSAVLGEQLETVFPELTEAVADADRDAAPLGIGDGVSETAVDTHTEIAFQVDGTMRHFDLQISSLNRGHGLLSGYLVSLRDVTERNQREQRLNVLNRALRHDLRNEANVVLGYAELGMRNHPDAEWLDAIQEHVSGLVDLSEKVRDIERALDGENVDPRPIEIVSLIEAAVDALEAERPDLDVDVDVPDEATVQAIDLVDLAIRNALENAVEHNDNPDTLVELSIRVRRTDDDTVAIDIADNGPGIHDMERQVLLRGRETQLEHVSGLGLWIINWIVTESGGRVEFDENEPRGSVVTLHLPATDERPVNRADEPEPRVELP